MEIYVFNLIANATFYNVPMFELSLIIKMSMIVFEHVREPSCSKVNDCIFGRTFVSINVLIYIIYFNINLYIYL